MQGDIVSKQYLLPGRNSASTIFNASGS